MKSHDFASCEHLSHPSADGAVCAGPAGAADCSAPGSQFQGFVGAGMNAGEQKRMNECKEPKISYFVIQCCFAYAYSHLTEGGSSSVWEMYGINV